MDKLNHVIDGDLHTTLDQDGTVLKQCYVKPRAGFGKMLQVEIDLEATFSILSRKFSRIQDDYVICGILRSETSKQYLTPFGILVTDTLLDYLFIVNDEFLDFDFGSGIDVVVASSKYLTDKGYAIGVKNDIPWKCSSDMKFFKNITFERIVIMGSKTADSIRKVMGDGLLGGRFNIVITRKAKTITDKIGKHENVVYVDSKEEALKVAKFTLTFSYLTGVSVIGGGEIYEMFKPLAARLYWTKIDREVPDADTFFNYDDTFESLGIIGDFECSDINDSAGEFHLCVKKDSV